MIEKHFVQTGHFVHRAINFHEKNRKAAKRWVTDASTRISLAGAASAVLLASRITDGSAWRRTGQCRPFFSTFLCALAHPRCRLECDLLPRAIAPGLRQ